jgi:hypothetical protein
VKELKFSKKFDFPLPEAVKKIPIGIVWEGEAPAEPFWISGLRLHGSAGASPSRIFSQLPTLGRGELKSIEFLGERRVSSLVEGSIPLW